MKKYTIKKNNTSISCIPERWWLITSIKIQNKELLFLNEETLFNLEKNVRWWIPIMFPNAWPLRENNIYNLKQHWFVRNKVWEYENISNEKFNMSLVSNEETKKDFDFDFRLDIFSEIISEKEIKISQQITNTSNDILPSSPWLHPYFYIKNEDKRNLKIFLWEELLDNYDFCDWKTVYLTNPHNIKMLFPDKSIIELNYDKKYQKLWIWSEFWKDFICIEPVYRDENALLDEPNLLLSWDIIKYDISIKM